MDEIIKEKLKVSSLIKLQEIEGGRISKAFQYMADRKNVFIKFSSNTEVATMFIGEYESLKAIRKTSTVYAPEPLRVVENYEGEGAIIIEYMELEALSNQVASKLGKQLARLHLHNIKIEQQSLHNEKYIGQYETNEKFMSQFGFHVPTSCGSIPQNNEWTDNWMDFYGRKLDTHVKAVQDTFYDRTVGELWSSIQRKFNCFFDGLEMKPSLLHGDLWNANVGEANKKPVIFDPSSFYGHHEYDLAIAGILDGFPPAFWSTYQKYIPRPQGWNDRHKLYKLFHYLNQWLHFGSYYKEINYQEISLAALRDLAT